MSDSLLNATLALGLASLALFCLGWLFSARLPRRGGDFVQVLFAAALTAWIVQRWAAAGRAPFATLFESVVLFAWSAGAVGLLLRHAFRATNVGILAALCECVALGYASTLDAAVTPLVPALRSNWLLVHVSTCVIAYGSFALGFGASILHLVRCRRAPEERDPISASAARAAALGFILLTVGIGTGAIWAKQAWGSYWGWDPKETWSLVTWLVYAAFLHLRFARNWNGAANSWFQIVGFVAVLFTYFGVSFLMKGLHSYA